MTLAVVTVLTSLAVAAALVALGWILGARAGAGVAPVSSRRPRITEEVAERLARLEDELGRRQARIADLEANQDALTAERDLLEDELRKPVAPNLVLLERLTPVVEAPPAPTVFAAASLHELLELVVLEVGVELALIADNHGLVVDAAGTRLPPEPLAAVTTILAEIGERLQLEDLPLAGISGIVVADQRELTLETRFFDYAGVRCALVLARRHGQTSPETLQAVIDAVREHLD